MRKEKEIQMKKEEEIRQKEELKKAEKSLHIEKEEPIKLNVSAGYKEIFMNEENLASIAVQDVMRMRVSKDQNNDGDFEFEELTLKALH